MINGIGNYGYNNFYTSYNTTASATGAETEEKLSASQIKAMKHSGQMKCETCSERKYQDGSNETDVSFKAPGHISPSASAATVMSHEREHVSNAFQSAGKNNGQVMAATVSLKHEICPECGRSYVSGGQTNTMIKYQKDSPYSMAAKSFDAANGAIGSNIDVAV